MKIFAVLKNPQVDVIADISQDEFLTYNEHKYCNMINMNNVGVAQVFDNNPFVTIIPFKMAKDYSVSMNPENISFMCECDKKLATIHTKEMEKAKEEKVPFLSKEEYSAIIEQRKKEVSKATNK